MFERCRYNFSLYSFSSALCSSGMLVYILRKLSSFAFHVYIP